MRRGSHLGWAFVLSLVGHSAMATLILDRYIFSQQQLEVPVSKQHELELVDSPVRAVAPSPKTSELDRPAKRSPRKPVKPRRRRPVAKAKAPECAPSKGDAPAAITQKPQPGPAASKGAPVAEVPKPVQPKPTSYDVTELDAVPSPVSTVKPRIPRMLVETKGSGLVILRVLINPAGRVTAVRVVKSMAQLGLDRPAIAAVRKWRYTQPRVKGKLVSAWLNQPILFRAGK